MDRGLRIRIVALFASALSGFTQTASAVDGVVEINQASALVGGVTSSDGPGFPVTVDAAGSYRLTGSLVLNASQANVDAILVTASTGVVIDLNGFSLQGPSSCTNLQPCSPAGTSRAIDATIRPGVVVRNGVVRGFPGGGVMLGTRSRVEDVTALGNGFAGIQVLEFGGVTGCTAGINFGHGILTGASSIVEGNVAEDNAENGIQTGLASVISRNTSGGNVVGIAAGGTSVVSENTARANRGSGIACTGCSLIGNAAHGNNGAGFQLDSGSGYSQSVLRSNNGGSDQPQVLGGVDLGLNICGASDVGNGIACP